MELTRTCYSTFIESLVDWISVSSGITLLSVLNLAGKLVAALCQCQSEA